MSEKLKLPNGYTATIKQDIASENPFEGFDCEPPIAVLNWERYHSKLNNYGGPELNLITLLDRLKPQHWQHGAHRRTILACLLFEGFEVEKGGDFKETVYEYAQGLSPETWTEWKEYFDAMEGIAALAGIPFYSGISNGYSQGHSARVFIAATSEWAKLVGAPADTLERQCKGAFDLWAAWAWGDVYGVAEITRPDGEEIEDGSCWGFYGADHDASGLMEHCKAAVEADIAWIEKSTREQAEYEAREALEAYNAACRDVATV
jgi:hypothetical protein